MPAPGGREGCHLPSRPAEQDETVSLFVSVAICLVEDSPAETLSGATWLTSWQTGKKPKVSSAAAATAAVYVGSDCKSAVG